MALFTERVDILEAKAISLDLDKQNPGIQPNWLIKLDIVYCSLISVRNETKRRTSCNKVFANTQTYIDISTIIRYIIISIVDVICFFSSSTLQKVINRGILKHCSDKLWHTRFTTNQTHTFNGDVI